MSDKRKDTYLLKIKFGFVDGDTRVINLDNPKNDLTAEKIHEVSQFISENNLLIGDKYGADFSGILTADLVMTTKVNLDL